MTDFLRRVGFEMKRMLRVFGSPQPPSRTDVEMKEEVMRRQEEVHARLQMLELEAAMKDQKFFPERRKVPRT